MSEHFKPKDLVWAKVDGYPWWPGFVLSQNSKKIEVMFFDDFTRAFLLPEKIKKYESIDFQELKKKSIYNRAL